jgi:hypothetical protein
MAGTANSIAGRQRRRTHKSNRAISGLRRCAHALLNRRSLRSTFPSQPAAMEFARTAARLAADDSCDALPGADDCGSIRIRSVRGGT